MRSVLWTRRRGAPCLYCVPSKKRRAQRFWPEPTARISLLGVTGRHIGSIPFFKVHEAESIYVPQTVTVCSWSRRRPAPKTWDRPDPPCLTYGLWQAEGPKHKPLLGVRACSFEMARRPCEPAARRLYQCVRLDFTIQKQSGSCKKDPHFEIYRQFNCLSIPFCFTQKPSLTS